MNATDRRGPASGARGVSDLRKPTWPGKREKLGSAPTIVVAVLVAVTAAMAIAAKRRAAERWRPPRPPRRRPQLPLRRLPGSRESALAWRRRTRARRPSATHVILCMNVDHLTATDTNPARSRSFRTASDSNDLREQRKHHSYDEIEDGA